MKISGKDEKMNQTLTIGLPRIHAEAGEKRDFLPEFVAGLEKNGAQLILEYGYGSGMGFSESDYRSVAPSVVFAPCPETFRQDYVVVTRCPRDEDLGIMRPNACLISMLHFPTRPQRVDLLRSLGIEAVSLDSIKDDNGRRLVENLESVAWNGIEAAFETLRSVFPSPGFESPDRRPIRITLLGAGAVGIHVLRAAIRYGNYALWHELASRGVPGALVTAVEYDTTRIKWIMMSILSETDVLVDATQRPDPGLPVIPNEWIAVMPQHAVLLDLSVDPYNCDGEPVYVKGIEGIPQGNLDQYVFAPDDPAYEAVPHCFSTTHRRYAVSCYSWPGVHPKECMEIYGSQIRPIMRNIIERGGIHNIKPNGRYFERAIGRAMLSRWKADV
jgi:alanine dehydrogenase